MKTNEVAEKFKTVYCVGFRSESSGGFDWFHEAIHADEDYVNAVDYFAPFYEKGDAEHDLVRFDVDIPADLTPEEITEYIDVDLDMYMDAAIAIEFDRKMNRQNQLN